MFIYISDVQISLHSPSLMGWIIESCEEENLKEHCIEILQEGRDQRSSGPGRQRQTTEP